MPRWPDTVPGAPPAEWLDGTAHNRLYRDGRLALENFLVADISAHLGDHGCLVWLDLCNPTPHDFEVSGVSGGWGWVRRRP